jgi:hypothetical protein
MSVPAEPVKPLEPPAGDSRPLPSKYDVVAAPPAPALEAVERTAAAPARPLHAVFVTHGMGQQIPYQTLDQIAEGLLQEDARRYPGKSKTRVASVEIGRRRETLQRIELRLGPDGAQGCDVHVYEGYWAPLTEGQVTLRNVMSFLLSAGGNGIANGAGEFRRWLFGQYRSFVTPVRTVLYLLIALAVTVSLVAINTAIVTVAAARSPLVQAPSWLTDGFVGDLSTTFNALLLVAGLFAASLLLSSRWPRRWLGIVSSVFFVSFLFAVVATAIALPCLFFLHLKQGKVDPEMRHGVIDPEILTPGHRWVGSLNTGIEILILLAAVAVGAWGLVWVWRRIAAKRSRGMAETGLAHTLSLVATVVFWLIVAGLGAEVFLFALKVRALPGIGAAHSLLRGVSWPVLVALSLFIRNFLIQYAGDVAVYVTPHRLDRFNDLRHRILDCVLSRARAIYEATVDGNPYNKVFIAGHSLGSVISYDVLNRLLGEDEAAAKRGDTPLGVRERTGLLLTFGSPLDKTAYLFAVQGQNQTDEAREALAASVQPLIVDAELREKLPWVNVYSPWDLFSGSLKFYDPPIDTPSGAAGEVAQPPGVINEPDTGALTLVLAHTQYWRKGGLIYRVLYQGLDLG